MAPGTGVHWPGQVVAVGILGRSVKRVPHSRRIRVVWQGPATTDGRGGHLVANACKRRHMGTVVGHRGKGVPRGTAVHLDKRRPVPCPATAKVASGIAVTAKGQQATEPEWVSSQWAAGERSHGQENTGAARRRRQDGNRGSPAVISLSLSGYLPPSPSSSPL